MSKITIDRAVVEQALDALKASRDRIVEAGGSGWKLSAQACTNAIAALRATLGQQQNEQESVAWIENLAGALSYNPYHEASRKLPEGVRFDLYTRPQPRQPLTDEAVLGVAKSIEIHFDSERLSEQIDDILAFASAIERAHGIGGNL